MLDDLRDAFDRDRRHGSRQRGLGGLLRRLAGDGDQPPRDGHRTRWPDDQDDNDGVHPRPRDRGFDVDLD
ncbi:MAG: hypothetical protein M3121_05390 [Chloroflexota bacterium]|nr:hypothetical protein [Chloroflexota bacterium]